MSSAQDFYNDMQAMAAEDLRPVSQGGFGQAFTLEITTPGGYNPATGVVELGETLAYQISGLRLDFELSRIDGEIVRSGDYRLMISPSLADGQPTPAMIPAGAKVSPLPGLGSPGIVISAAPMAPSGQLLYVDLHMRGA